MYVCHGMIFAASGFLIPKLEDSKDGFGISVDEGSWVGKNFVPFFHFIKKTFKGSKNQL